MALSNRRPAPKPLAFRSRCIACLVGKRNALFPSYVSLSYLLFLHQTVFGVRVQSGLRWPLMPIFLESGQSYRRRLRGFS